MTATKTKKKSTKKKAKKNEEVQEIQHTTAYKVEQAGNAGDRADKIGQNIIDRDDEYATGGKRFLEKVQNAGSIATVASKPVSSRPLIGKAKKKKRRRQR